MKSTKSSLSSPSTSSSSNRKRPASPSSTHSTPQNSELTHRITSTTQSLIPQTLLRLTEGLPQHELQQMIDDAKECEEALQKEIKILEDAAGLRSKKDKDKQHKGPTTGPTEKKAESGEKPRPPIMTPWGYDTMGGLNYHTSVDAMLTSELAPPDRFDTVSALLGRLRAPLNDGLYPPNSTIALKRKAAAQKKSNKKESAAHQLQNEMKQNLKLLDKQKALIELESRAVYRKEQSDTAALLALWKRVSSHRTAAVFRRPVNSREAPRYADKILFPIDLSLIRKMITAGIILSFADLHQRIGLMCHNCVKFNGRESDYGVITREFEAYVDDSMLEAVAKAEALAHSLAS